MIDRSKPDMIRHVIRSRLSSLSHEQRLALECLADVGPITSGSIYECYAERSESSVGDRTMRGWFPKFEEYELIDVSGPCHEPTCEVREVVLEELGVMVSQRFS